MLAKFLNIKRFLKDDAVPTINVAGNVPPKIVQIEGRLVYSRGVSAVPTHSKVKLILNIMRLFNFMIKLFACFHFKDNSSQ